MSESSKLMLLPLLAAIVMLFVQPSAGQGTIEFLIINNQNPLPCPNITNPTLCNATTYCVASGSGVCGVKPLVVATNRVNVTVAAPWCRGKFPEPFIALLFFLTLLTTGYCSSVMIYTVHYYKTYSMIIDGDRMFNLFFMRTKSIHMFFGTILFFCLLLGISAWVYYVNPESCFYYFATILFLVFGLCLPVVLVVGYIIYLFIMWYLKEEVVVNLDDYIMPTTKEAMPTLRNQVRCF